MVDRSNGTNGELSIEELLEKDPLIKKLLDEGEVIEYISYKKGIFYKFVFGFLFIMGAWTLSSSFDLIVLLLLVCLPIIIFIEGSFSKLIITNKGIIIRSTFKWEVLNKGFCTDKFYYSDIKEVGWSDYRFHNHLKIKIKNKKYHHRFYPQGPNITEEQAMLIVELVKKKMSLKGIALLKF